MDIDLIVPYYWLIITSYQLMSDNQHSNILKLDRKLRSTAFHAKPQVPGRPVFVLLGPLATRATATPSAGPGGGAHGEPTQVIATTNRKINDGLMVDVIRINGSSHFMTINPGLMVTFHD